ncbi:MAG: neutral/alkaline non-lysosomal ceramidase N-terminal domain-containing protein [Planctomycetes bacterium]|nr:neutral/alkaline non-lysosomal ceramidase N-terminal domain-containing protein [Planctomycetota bacterium]
MRLLNLVLVSGLTLACGLVSVEPADAGWKAGIAKSIITPKKPMWMAGYGGRTGPAEGAQHDLWIRVLALEDEHGHRGIVLSSDTLGFPQSIADELAGRLKQQFGLDRSQVLLHASHTHCGPVLRGALYDAYPLDAAQIALINEYSDWFTTEVAATIGRALKDLQPATVSRGQGSTDFAVNRRTNREPDVPMLREQNLLFGPVDHTVPVLAIHAPDGTLRAVVFAYACHNTTLSFMKWCGDYAGFAQYDLEARHPGAVALFCMGCGADQNPLPRRMVELAESYGKRLASAVNEVLSTPMEPVEAALRTSHEFVQLRMAGLPKIEELRTMAAGSPDYRQRWAARMLELSAGKQVPTEYPYPITAWKLGTSQIWITMGGEVVVDYALRLKGEYGERTWVTAYANDVMAYIPSRRVLIEGGYEGQSSMMVYGLPTERWADDVEDRIAMAVERCLKKLTADKPSASATNSGKDQQ